MMNELLANSGLTNRANADAEINTIAKDVSSQVSTSV